MPVVSREEEEADEERWIRYGSLPLIATLVLPIIISVIILLKCVFHHCCVRKTTSKDEMYGVEGRMTMLATADSNFSTTLLPLNGNASVTPGSSRPNTNQSGSSLPLDQDGITTLSLVDQHVRDREVRDDLSKPKDLAFGKVKVSQGVVEESYKSTSPCFDDGISKRFSGSGSTQLKLASASNDSCELTGTLKRPAAPHRQLPDLPPTPHGTARISQQPRRSSSVLSNDGTSELYATVGLVNSSSGDPPTASSVPSRARGNEATPSSDSETYAGSTSHHPYAKLKKNIAEHPYARVRGNASSANNNNDEETDTDNYDLPQFLNNSRQVGALPGNVQSPSSSTSSANRHLPSSSGSQNNEVIGRRNSAEGEGPVPPRRVGREWRRPGPSQPQMNMNDMSSHFSGDSQDSRGYTSISVREPLSNIRNEVTATGRNFDSHYATVSDDSEEMYAAIDDPSDANYMRIGDRQRDNNSNQSSRPSWMGGPNVSSPIPERREANSPLPPVPPVPNVPPPDSSPGPSSSAIPPPLSPHSQLHSQPPPPQTTTLPVYAQVTKKSKKQQQKTPLTTTLSNTSTASSQQTVREGVSASVPESTVLREGSSAISLHPPHHRSKRAASLMDNSNTMDADSVDTRRWSKADISYSEFEVVRENVFVPINTNKECHRSNPGNDTVDAPVAKSQELLDEDNYNIIPDKSSRNNQRHTPTTPSSNVQRELDSGNYHEIEPKNLNNTYQEIGCGKEPSDHYQEIGRDGSELYQEIDRKDRHSDDDDDEEDEADQFYEKVKKPGFDSKKKHGYEKIKKKGEPRSSNLQGETSTSGRRFAPEPNDEDDDDGPDEMYECVKYPPYERLKEMEDDVESEDGKGSNYYEDIGYTRVKHKNKATTTASTSQNHSSTDAKDKNYVAADKSSSDVVGHPVQDVHQLYAQIDKTKKRKGKANASTTLTNIIKVEDIRVNNNNEPNLTISSSSGSIEEQRVLSKGAISKSPVNKNTESHFTDGAEVQNRLTNDNSIEYI